MKYNTVIIGGGLAGLISGIMLSRAGQRVAIVSAGQSALHFGSGSLELLGKAGGQDVKNPLEAIDLLPATHPYRRLGRDRVATLLPEIQPLLAGAGVSTTGSYTRNRYRLTPLGKIRPAWLTLDDFVTFDTPEKLPWRHVAIVNVADFQDFYPSFLAAGLEKLGVKCTCHEINLPALDGVRRSATEMRSSTIARVLDDTAVRALATRLNDLASRDIEAFVMPAILGIDDARPVELLRRHVSRPVHFIPTMPTSVPDVRTHRQLVAYFTKLGGIFMPGDSVKRGEMEGDRLARLFTVNHDDEPLQAETFILATGSFFSHGLIATPDAIIEPVFGLDVNAPGDRSQWYSKDFYAEQPYMSFGVVADDLMRPSRQGTIISNLYAAGSVLGGCNPLKEGCGGGVAILTAMAVAQNILSR